jgi:hypothetical protein
VRSREICLDGRALDAVSRRASWVVSSEAGRRYPIRVAFIDLGGPAEAGLFWWSRNLDKAAVPTKLLYPSEP